MHSISVYDFTGHEDIDVKTIGISFSFYIVKLVTVWKFFAIKSWSLSETLASVSFACSY